MKIGVITILFVVGTTQSMMAFRVFNTTHGTLEVAYISATQGEVHCTIPPQSENVISCKFKDQIMDADVLLKPLSIVKVRRIMYDALGQRMANVPDKEGTYDKCQRGSTCELQNLYVSENDSLPQLIITNVPAQP